MARESKAGRKPIKDKKVPITLYFRGSQIKAMGGMGKMRNVCYLTLEKLNTWEQKS